MLARFITTMVGIVLIVYGVIAAISPLPLGVPLIVLGVMMIAAANPAARPIIRRMREKWRWFDFLVSKIGERSSGPVKEVADETTPDHHDDDDGDDNHHDDGHCKTERTDNEEEAKPLPMSR